MVEVHLICLRFMEITLTSQALQMTSRFQLMILSRACLNLVCGSINLTGFIQHHKYGFRSKSHEFLKTSNALREPDEGKNKNKQKYSVICCKIIWGKVSWEFKGNAKRGTQLCPPTSSALQSIVFCATVRIYGNIFLFPFNQYCLPLFFFQFYDL